MPSGKTISQDAVDMLRYMHVKHNLSYSKIGELVGRPKNYIGRLLSACDPITGVRVLQKKGRKTKTNDEVHQAIRQMALENPFIGCEALTKMFNESSSEVKLSKSSIHRRLKEVGINVVKVSAVVEDGPEDSKKRYPKQQTLWKFEQVPEKKKRVVKKRKKAEPQAETQPEVSELVLGSLQESVVPEVEMQQGPQSQQSAVQTINILIDPTLGYPEVIQFA
ncbi:hypothetical protein RvY_02593 [Ramazzottius varieornatus]|uniref:Transposase Tc1-like domain-containing protein n=1 Tax=Ramazzottius varieornatus TaxID=947166 RepID=A0A1D1UKA0_RAMVA|nr:hypothetical protein RvY_02593 [Ramazzottius varieornatus]